MSEFDDVYESWLRAKLEYDTAERALAMARSKLMHASGAKQAMWDILVQRARIQTDKTQ